MENIYLSKSRYCMAKQCNKALWLSRNMPDVKTEIDKDRILDNGTEVGELARGLFGEYTNIEYNEDLSKMLEQTSELFRI